MGHQLARWKCVSSPDRDLREIFSYICMNVSSIFPPFGRTVILKVKGLLIACLLPADRSTENLQAHRIQRWWSVVICPRRDDSYSLPSALNIRPISRPEMTEVKIRKDEGRGT